MTKRDNRSMASWFRAPGDAIDKRISDDTTDESICPASEVNTATWVGLTNQPVAVDIVEIQLLNEINQVVEWLQIRRVRIERRREAVLELETDAHEHTAEPQ
jgi:hypothetical protein